MTSSERTGCLILGIGNTLYGDEGVGVRVVRRLAETALPEGVECLDGGTGGLHLLGPLEEADRVVLVDATVDGNPPGTFRRLEPRFSADYPPSLTAHDIGLKDLLDALELLGPGPPVTLFAVSIEPLGEMSTSLSPAVERRLPALVQAIRDEVGAEAVREPSPDRGSAID